MIRKILKIIESPEKKQLLQPHHPHAAMHAKNWNMPYCDVQYALPLDIYGWFLIAIQFIFYHFQANKYNCYLTPFNTCSAPLLFFMPQWKCNCSISYCSFCFSMAPNIYGNLPYITFLSIVSLTKKRCAILSESLTVRKIRYESKIFTSLSVIH